MLVEVVPSPGSWEDGEAEGVEGFDDDGTMVTLTRLRNGQLSSRKERQCGCLHGVSEVSGLLESGSALGSHGVNGGEGEVGPRGGGDLAEASESGKTGEEGRSKLLSGLMLEWVEELEDDGSC